MERQYSIAQLSAALEAAKARWQIAGITDAGMWLLSVHRLTDRLAMARFMENIKC